MSERLVGVVKWFNAARGYGFIGRENGEDDVFVYYADIHMDGFRKLHEHQRVEFTLTVGPKGLQAINVRPLDNNEHA